MDLSINHQCTTCVLSVCSYLCSTSVDFCMAAIIAALDLAQAVILESDVGKVQLGWLWTTAVGLQVWQGVQSSEIRLDGVSLGVMQDNCCHPMWFLTWQDVVGMPASHRLGSRLGHNGGRCMMMMMGGMGRNGGSRSRRPFAASYQVLLESNPRPSRRSAEATPDQHGPGPVQVTVGPG